MARLKINTDEFDFSMRINPGKEIIASAIEFFNENLITNNFQYLMRSEIFDGADADKWYKEQIDETSIRLVGMIDHSTVISIAYLHRHHNKSSHSAKLGITVSPAYQRRGIAIKMCEKLFTFGKKKGIERVEAHPVIKNKDAIFLLKHLGFTIEGTASKKYKLDESTYYDCLHMAKLL